jgi:hypothetical protein
MRLSVVAVKGAYSALAFSYSSSNVGLSCLQYILHRTNSYTVSFFVIWDDEKCRCVMNGIGSDYVACYSLTRLWTACSMLSIRLRVALMQDLRLGC